MKYGLNLDATGRVLSATFWEHASEDALIVDMLTEGDIYEYRYVDGVYIHDPLPEEEAEETETVDPQADTDAMLIDHEYRLTMLELGLTE